MPVSLFVGNLPYNATEGELRELFSTIGPLVNVYLPTDRETGKLRGFAFVEYREDAHAQEALRRFQQQLFKGRPLMLKEARAREERPRSGAPSRPSAVASPAGAGSPMNEPASQLSRPARNFGPDATPRRRSKKAQRPERGPKGPMREVGRAQFFGEGDDDSHNGDFEGENFASSDIHDEE
jgi:RNA recognition motif-containing protein